MGRERDGIDDRVNGNNLGRAFVGRERFYENAELLGRVFKANSSHTIAPKKCTPKTCQSFLGNRTCIVSLALREAKRAELLAQGFQDKFHQRDCPEKLCGQDFSNCLFINAGQWKKFVARGVSFCTAFRQSMLHLRSFRREANKMRTQLNENPTIGDASA